MAESHPSKTAGSTNGMALVQKLNGGDKTFAEMANQVLSAAPSEGSQSTRIDVAFEVYDEVSIKQMERVNRGAVFRTQVKQIVAGHNDYKENLITFLKEWN